MPVFVYSAADAGEKVTQGIIEAQDAREARMKIRSTINASSLRAPRILT